MSPRKSAARRFAYVPAAMSLSVPTYRFTYDEIIAASDLVRSKADALSARLGYQAASSSLAS